MTEAMPVTAPSHAIGTFRSVARMVRDNWALLRPQEKFAAVGIAFSSLVSSMIELAALSTVVPFASLLIDPAAVDRYPFIQNMASRFELADRDDLFLALGAGVIISLTIGFAFRMIVYFLVGYFSMCFTNRISSETLRECLSAPYVWLRGQNGTLLAQRITLDIPTAGQDLYPVVLEVLYGVFILLLGIMAILIASSWQAIIVILAIGAVGLSVLAFLNPRSSRFAVQVRDRTLAGNRLAVEIFAGRKLIKASQSEQFFNNRYLSVFESHTAARMRLHLVNKAVPFSILLIGQIGILVLAMSLVLSNFTIGPLIAELTFILLVLSRVLPAISAMSGSINILSNVEPFFHGLVDLRAELVPWRDQPVAESPGVDNAFMNWHQITLAEVEFDYGSGNDPQIRGIDATIERGQNIGIAGPSGAGKSTLVDLILGLLPPDRGHVMIDGHRLDDNNRAAWLTMIGYVPQDPYVMDDSLRRNIAFGVIDADIDDCKIWSALEQVQLKELVRSWPSELDTVIGEDGSRLSGGQRQRVAIARTLYRGATLLVLDEATNALDTEAEQTINKTVRAIPGLTSIMIAHRLTALRECDRILLIDNGHLVAGGRFADLLENNTLFSHLVLEAEQSSEHKATPARHEPVK